MAGYAISRPRPDVIRVVFSPGWDAEAESEAMFREVLAALDASERDVTLLVVAGQERPVYKPSALGAARGILTHERLKRMIVVAEDARLAVTHMGATRGARGLPPIPMQAFDSEEEALASLQA